MEANLFWSVCKLVGVCYFANDTISAFLTVIYELKGGIKLLIISKALTVIDSRCKAEIK